MMELNTTKETEMSTGWVKQIAADEHMAKAVDALRIAVTDLQSARLAYAKLDLWPQAGGAGSYLEKIQDILNNLTGEHA